jgi:cytochrome P450
VIDDLFSDAMRRNPYPAYERMRDCAPVFHLAPFDLWMIFDFEGVKRALVDHDAFSSDLSHVPGSGNPGEWFIFFDPPRHTKLRALIAKAFTPRVVANLEPRIRELSRQLLDQASERGEMDLAAEFSVPLPMWVIAEMLGVPAADWPRYKRWSDVILKLANTFARDEEAARTLNEYAAVTAEMRAFLPDLIAQRRSAHQEDLLTRLVEAEVDGERVSQDEILGFVQLLLVGGQETTRTCSTTPSYVSLRTQTNSPDCGRRRISCRPRLRKCCATGRRSNGCPARRGATWRCTAR